MWRAPVHQADGDAGVDRVEDRSLTLDPEQVAALPALDDEPLGRAGEEVGDDRVDGDAPAGDRDARLAGRDEHRTQAAIARLEVELAGRGHLPDRTVGADRQDDRRVDLEVRARRRAQVARRLAEIAQFDSAFAGELGEIRNVVEPDVQPVLDVEPLPDTALQQVLPIARKVAALGDDSDEGRVRLVLHPLVDGSDDGDSVLARSCTFRVEDRHDRLPPVTQHSPHRLAVVRVVRELFSEDQVLLL